MTELTADDQTLAEELQAFRHDLHRFPELSNEEFATTRKLRAALVGAGLHLPDLPLPTGVVAEAVGDPAGPLVVLRADIDALPIDEASGVPFASQQPGVMHACGHDFHTAAALGAARLLQRQRHMLPGRVRILFQAAEETGQGAPAAIAAGVLDGAAVIFGLHNDPTLPVGVVGSRAGALTASVDRFAIRIRAKGAHAGKPHEGSDPIVIAAQLVSAVQMVISRNVPSDQNAVVSLTQIHSGSTWNVIPDSAWLEGTVRTFSAEARALIETRLRALLDGLATAFAAQITLDWQPGPPSVMNTSAWVDFALEQAAVVGLEARRVDASPIGEDFAFYQQHVPGAFVMVGSGGPWALHHPQFRVDDRALFPTARYLTQLARAALEKLA